MTPTARKSRVQIEFPETPPGCGPTCEITVFGPPRKRCGTEPVIDQCVYAITEIPAFNGERAFEFARMDLGREETWHVRRVNAKWTECDCQGFVYSGRPCKHVLTVERILESEKYVEPLTLSGATV